VTSSSLDAAKIAAAIDVLGLGVEVAEFHGGICGLLSSGGPGAVATWLRQSGGSTTAPASEIDNAREQLHEAEAESWRLLGSPEFEFEALMPPIEADLDDRVTALALWCQGFVTGLGLGGIRGEDLGADEGEGARSTDLTEIVSDFVEISRAHLGSEDLEDTDRADFDLAELIEYVRVSAQLVFEELRGRHEPPAFGAEPRATH